MKKQKISIVVVAVLVIVVALVVIIRNTNSKIHDLPELIASGKLTVVTDSSSNGFALQKDSVFGFQYEIVKAFADSLGLELRISKQNDAQKAINELLNGEFDIIANTMPVTTDYPEGVVFSKPLMTSKLILVQKLPDDSLAEIPIKKQFELGNDTIYLSRNSAFKARLQNLSNEIAEEIHIEEINNVSVETMVKLVSTGKIKNTVCTEEQGLKLKKLYNNIDISLALGFNQHYSWVVNSKSPLLLEKLNAFLSDFIGSEAYWKLYSKYF